jgi:hypothetical protein
VPFVDAYSDRKERDVMQESWGHLDAKPGQHYSGTMLFAHSAYGGERVLIDATWDGLDDSPRLYADVREFIEGYTTVEGRVYRWQGTYVRRRDGGHFIGPVIEVCVHEAEEVSGVVLATAGREVDAVHLTDAETERFLAALSFVKNRLDGVSLDVVSWMPPEDNEQHHNAVEMLLRAFQTASGLEELLVQRSGYRAYPTPGNLERIAGKIGLAARFVRERTVDQSQRTASSSTAEEGW